MTKTVLSLEKLHPLTFRGNLDLSMILDIFPLIYSDLRLSFSPSLYDSNSYPRGGCFFYADILPHRYRILPVSNLGDPIS